jgi:glutamate transport system substrate-binding protein
MTATVRRLTMGLVASLAAAGICASCTGAGAGHRTESEDSTASPSATSPNRSVFRDEPVTVAVKRNQPGFSARDSSGHTGFDVDLVHYISQELGFKKRLTEVAAHSRESVLVGGEADFAAASYTITDARDERIDYTAPYFKTYQGLLVRRGSTSIRHLDDVRGKRVCSATGSTSDPGSAADRRQKTKIIEAIGVDAAIGLRKDYRTCVADLRKGAFEAVWTDRILLEGFAQQAGGSQDLEVVRDVAIENRQFYGIGIAEGREEDCRRLNSVLKKFLAKSWRETFRDHFPHLADSDPSFEQNYKPTESEFRAYRGSSCGAED